MKNVQPDERVYLVVQRTRAKGNKCLDNNGGAVSYCLAHNLMACIKILIFKELFFLSLYGFLSFTPLLFRLSEPRVILGDYGYSKIMHDKCSVVCFEKNFKLDLNCQT